MTDRLITADARTTSGADFFRALQGRPPMTAAERADRKAAADEYWRRRDEELARIRAETLANIEAMKAHMRKRRAA